MNTPDSSFGLTAPLPITHAHSDSVLTVGKFVIRDRIVLAPMAGVTDYPFRRLCRELGAGYAVAEMTSAQRHLYQSAKSQRRIRRGDDESPFVVQIIGNDAQALADTARFHEQQGANIIDVNMGCPAKKLLKKAAGSALLADEKKVGDILNAVVRAVSVSVTLKFRTGINVHHKNAVRVARIAEDAGVALLSLHGRTRDCLFRGEAEYNTIRDVKAAVRIPVLANGDIDSVSKAQRVLAFTGADGVMIGRAALGRPWFFRALAQNLFTNADQKQSAELSLAEKGQWIMRHLDSIHEFYGEKTGARLARKHLLAYARYLGVRPHTMDENFYSLFISTENALVQKQMWQTLWHEIEQRTEGKYRMSRKAA